MPDRQIQIFISYTRKPHFSVFDHLSWTGNPRDVVQLITPQWDIPAKTLSIFHGPKPWTSSRRASPDYQAPIAWSLQCLFRLQWVIKINIHRQRQRQENCTSKVSSIVNLITKRNMNWRTVGANQVVEFVEQDENPYSSQLNPDLKS